MALPRNFSEDGAFGAGGDGSAALASGGGSSTGGFSMSDPGPSSQPSYNAPTSSPAASSGGDGGFSAPSYQPPKKKTPNDYPVGSSEWQSQFIQDTTGITHPEFLQNTGGFQRIASFSQGGAIEDDDFDGNGSPAQENIQRALSNIEGVLAFGRKLHGLGGGDNEGAINTAGAMPMIPGNQSQTPGPYKPQPRPQQVAGDVVGIRPGAMWPDHVTPGPNLGGAVGDLMNKTRDRSLPDDKTNIKPLRIGANMPTRPAGQSETGIPPQAPGPGTLPPTSNPFGKRADNDQDDGGIDTDEDA